MRAALILALLASASCSDVSFLSSEGMSSLLLVELDGAAGNINAFDLTTEVVVQRPASERASTYALQYVAPLDELGISAGVVAQGTSGQLLKAPDRQHLLEGGAWTKLEAVPAAIAGLRLEHIDRCAQFVARQSSFPRAPEENVRFMLALDDERAFAGTDNARFYIITATGATQLTALSTATPSLTAAMHDGEIWLAGPGRKVVRGHPDRGFTPAPPLPFALGSSPHMDSSAEGAPLQLFVTDETLSVAYFDGDSWRIVRNGSGITGERVQARIAWAEPGVAVLTGTDRTKIIEIDSSGFERVAHFEIPLRPSPDGVWNVARVDGVGVIVASRYNVVFRRDAMGWSRLALPLLTPVADVITGIGGGSFMAGGQDGIFVEWRADGEVCKPLTGLGVTTAHAFAMLGDGFVQIADTPGDSYSLWVGTRIR